MFNIRYRAPQAAPLGLCPLSFMCIKVRSEGQTRIKGQWQVDYSVQTKDAVLTLVTQIYINLKKSLL